MAEFIKVASVSDVEEGAGKVVEAGGKAIALFKVQGNFYAIDNTCVHRGGPLGEGFLEEFIVTCPWHGWRYDITTGKCIMLPNAQVAKYNIKIEGNDVFVEVRFYLI